MDIETTRSLRVNHDRGWRQRIARILISIARKIDGRIHVSIEMQSIPPVARATRLELVKAGIAHTDRLFLNEIRLEAIEYGMQEMNTELMSDENHEKHE